MLAIALYAIFCVTSDVYTDHTTGRAAYWLVHLVFQPQHSNAVILNQASIVLTHCYNLLAALLYMVGENVVTDRQITVTLAAP
jgi:hypothetical protein